MSTDTAWESFTVRMPSRMMREFEKQAEHERRSKNGQANVYIRAGLDADKQRRAGK